ncbi:hypothetical protein RT717_01750 [Imperialibacter roseus]|uniref:Uncharacterized protein n=1 Tax=Imperialibacter roseus TaxID=1324217 RepID=A0ABZ0ISF3_9BACT|nr:hypothetical protein [Imperialibacter roseus]WOK07344.1 hypothetical protein RT717_01750 [Imperialibacter roseus]
MHKSSSLTFLYKYFFPACWVGVVILAFVVGSNADDELPKRELLGVSVIVFWIAFWSILVSIRLRSAVTQDEYLVIRALREEVKIRYDQITYVCQPVLANPVLVGLQYRDDRTQEVCDILIMPSRSEQLFSFNLFSLNEVPMTKFIRRQSKRANPDYNEHGEPSRWRPSLYIISSGIIAWTVSSIILQT